MAEYLAVWIFATWLFDIWLFGVLDVLLFGYLAKYAIWLYGYSDIWLFGYLLLDYLAFWQFGYSATRANKWRKELRAPKWIPNSAIGELWPIWAG